MFDKVVRMITWRYGGRKTPEDREDYSQICQIALLREEKTLSLMPEPDASKYAYILCRNEILNILRTEHPELSLSDNDIKEEIQKNPEFLKIDDSIDAEIIIRKLDKLPNPYPEVLKRRFGIGCPEETLTEIADRLGVTAMTIQRWEKLGLELLKKRMKI